MRTKLARELRSTCPPGDARDCNAIMAALERGEAGGIILFMPETFRWPKTYHWLKERL